MWGRGVVGITEIRLRKRHWKGHRNWTHADKMGLTYGRENEDEQSKQKEWCTHMHTKASR